MMTEDIIKKRLAFLNPTQFKLENESELHRGHKGNNGGEHFNLYIVSDSFEDKNTMERHRLIYKALEDLIPETIHALSIKTFAPTEL
ncbi:MAG: BolA family transcriptional regulator [Betaproteobacteria bacterium]|nr:BolA family transcriptional regulator [Nitrosomonadales bacterium]MCH9771422.1 BolA family transcriptional regulator [Betaproteobacteria bacterium]